MEHQVIIHSIAGSGFSLELGSGQSTVILGANGSGKTRLGVFIETQFGQGPVLRIAAQRSLALNDKLAMITRERADQALRYGYPDGGYGHKIGHRWGSNPAVHPLNDFDALVQLLFADHARSASEFLSAFKKDPETPPPTTKLDKLVSVWGNLLPHRQLRPLEIAVEVRASGAKLEVAGYPGSQMSDGERAIFYLLGQCVVAPDDCVIIVDEPEGHIHKAILGLLWDAIEKMRPDCAFVYITHDIDFATARNSARKYFIRTFQYPERWDIQALPDDTGLPDTVVAELVGSRKPILFVEGDKGSIDLTLYRSRYPDFTIMPIGSCEAVIHSVSSFGRSESLHWIKARGLVDADDRAADEVASLEAKGVYVLPVAEVENVFLLPDIFLELAELLACADPGGKLATIKEKVLEKARADVDGTCVRHTLRQLDRYLKRLGMKASDMATLCATFDAELAKISPSDIGAVFRKALERSIDLKEHESILRLYDNKGLLTIAASELGLKSVRELHEKVGRFLGDERGKKLADQIAKALPNIST